MHEKKKNLTIFDKKKTCIQKVKHLKNKIPFILDFWGRVLRAMTPPPPPPMLLDAKKISRYK